MSKELEALKRMAEYRFEAYGVERDDGTDFDEDFEIIENGLKRLEAIDNTKASEAVESLEDIGFAALNECYGPPYTRISDEYDEDFKTIKNYILKSQEDKKKVEALKELFTNHIELVVEKDKCYFKIKNSKGNEKSFTSYTMLDFWKEVLE